MQAQPLTALAVFAAAFSLTAPGVIGTASAAVTMPAIDAEVVAYLGPTGNPTGTYPFDMATILDGALNVGREIRYIWTPEEFRPATGRDSLTLDASVADGTSLALAAIDGRDHPSLMIVGSSQSSIVLSEVKRYYEAHPESAPPVGALTFVLGANPNRPNGGILARFPGVHLPRLGVTFSGPTPGDGYFTFDAGWLYDGVVSFPRYPLDLLSTMNAVMGMLYLHGRQPDPFDPASDCAVWNVGSSTYYTVVPQHLPMLQPLVDAGLTRFVAAVEPVLKVWVDAGYTDNDPLANPGVATTAAVFLPRRNALVAWAKTPAALHEGLSNALRVERIVAGPARVRRSSSEVPQQARALRSDRRTDSAPRPEPGNRHRRGAAEQ